MKSLVVFYSRTGSTKKVGEAIAQKLNCDIEEIISIKNRTGFFGLIRSGFETAFKKLPEIKNIEHDPSLYDIVIIGTPVWGGTMASPIRTFLSQHKEQFKKVAFFCTCGSDTSDTFKDMESICGKTPLIHLAPRRREVAGAKYIEKLNEFTEKILNKSVTQ